MAANYTLFGTKGSGSAAVEAALVLQGAGFRIVDAASWEPGPGRDELARVNPLCQIPTLLLPDGSVLTESAAILLHLGLAHPDSPLLPADAARRAQSLRGLVYVAANCYAAIGIIDYPERWCTDADDATGKRIKAGATQRLHYLWDVFADTFPAQPFLTGERLGALDLLAAVVSKWSGARKHLAASRPAFSALLARIEGDPRVAPVFARHWPPSS
ncbi:MAG: glutathione S-transferase [Casimicrobiaceae bacterium]